jgi:hypothetical protein
MCQSLVGELEEFKRLLKFADNDFFQISMTFGILNRIAGPVELVPPLCRTQGEFLLVRNSLLVATVIGLGRLYCANPKNPCLPEVMGFFYQDAFVSAVQEHYVSLARSMRPELFSSNETHFQAKAISEFESRKSDLKLHWEGVMKSREVSSVVKLRHKRYAHSDLKKATGKRAKIPDLKFDDLKKVVDETESLFAAITIMIYGAGVVANRTFSAPLDLLNAPTVWWEHGPFS